MDQDGSEAQEMKCLIFLILLIGSKIDPQSASIFPRLHDKAAFTSGVHEARQWISETREYCFLEKELSYFLQYEFSPVPIPAFKVKNGISDVYISVDIDAARPIRFQKLIDEWAKFSDLNKNETVCFEGAYLPPSTPKDAAYIMIDQIKGNGLQLALEDFWMELN